MLEERIVQELARIVGAENVSVDSADRILHAFDATQGHFLPEVVVHATTTDQVSRVVRLAHEHRIPILPRGAGSGFTGGSLPIRGGIVLVLTRMNRILARSTRTTSPPRCRAWSPPPCSARWSGLACSTRSGSGSSAHSAATSPSAPAAALRQVRRHPRLRARPSRW